MYIVSLFVENIKNNRLILRIIQTVMIFIIIITNILNQKVRVRNYIHRTSDFMEI